MAARQNFQLGHGAADAGEPGIHKHREPRAAKKEVDQGCDGDGRGIVSDGGHGNPRMLGVGESGDFSPSSTRHALANH